MVKRVLLHPRRRTLGEHIASPTLRHAGVKGGLVIRHGLGSDVVKVGGDGCVQHNLTSSGAHDNWFLFHRFGHMALMNADVVCSRGGSSCAGVDVGGALVAGGLVLLRAGGGVIIDRYTATQRVHISQTQRKCPTWATIDRVRHHLLPTLLRPTVLIIMELIILCP